MSCHVGAGNWTWVLCNSNRYSSPLSRLSQPHFLNFFYRHAFNPSPWEAETDRQIYRASSRIARATERNLLSKTKPNQKPNNNNIKSSILVTAKLSLQLQVDWVLRPTWTTKILSSGCTPAPPPTSDKNKTKRNAFHFSRVTDRSDTYVQLVLGP